MKRVEIYRLLEGGRQDVVAVCRLEGGRAICEGAATGLVERLNKDGILDRRVKPAERIFPTDGRKFLESLENHFKSGYLNASPIIRD